MKILSDANEIDVVWEWGRAEIESARFGEGYALLSPRIRAALRVGDRDDLAPEDLEQVRKVVRFLRAPVLEDLFRLGTTWKRAGITISEVGPLRVVNWPPLASVDPSRTIEGIARFLDRGGEPPDHAFGQGYRALRPVFSMFKMQGRPLLLAENEAGPYSVLEGYTRCAVIASAYLARELADGPLEVIVGICPQVRDWHRWQQQPDRNWVRTNHKMW